MTGNLVVTNGSNLYGRIYTDFYGLLTGVAERTT